MLSSNCWLRHLPSLVLAFYVTHRATAADIASVVATRAEFLRNYSLPAATAPLVALYSMTRAPLIVAYFSYRPVIM